MKQCHVCTDDVKSPYYDYATVAGTYKRVPFCPKCYESWLPRVFRDGSLSNHDVSQQSNQDKHKFVKKQHRN